MDNFQDTLLAQYANSARIKMIIDGFNQAADPSLLIDRFFETCFDPATATAWGLDVWGRIVGVSRIIKASTGSCFGFAEGSDGSETGAQPFNQAPFYNGKTATSNFRMPDEWFRQLIFCKAAANITDCSIPSLNKILMMIFGTKVRTIWISDNQDMTMTINYNWQLSPVEAAILENSGVLPRPSGVRIKYQYIADTEAYSPAVTLPTFTVGNTAIVPTIPPKKELT